MSRTGNSIDAESKLVVAGGCGGLGKMRVTVNGYRGRVSLWDHMKVLKLTVVMAAQLCEYTKKY